MFLRNDNDSQLEIIPKSDGFTAIVKRTRNIFLIVQLSAGLALWIVFGGLANAALLLNSDFPRVNVIAGLLLWLVLTVVFSYIWLWNLFGEEIIYSNNETLVINRSILQLINTKSYPIQEITNLRVNVIHPFVFSFEWNMRYWGLGGDSISFEWKGKTRVFGHRLSEDSALKLINAIQVYSRKRL